MPRQRNKEYYAIFTGHVKEPTIYSSWLISLYLQQIELDLTDLAGAMPIPAWPGVNRKIKAAGPFKKHVPIWNEWVQPRWRRLLRAGREKRLLWMEMDFTLSRMEKGLVSIPIISRYFRSPLYPDVHGSWLGSAAKMVLRKKSLKKKVHAINDLERRPKPKLSLKIGKKHTLKSGAKW